MWLHPEIRTLPDIVRHWSARTPEKEALRAGKATLTYRDLESVTNRIGGKLAALGHERRNVCFIGKNVPEFWTLWLGAGKAGSPIVPLNWRFAIPELVELVDDAEPAIVFADSEYAETMQQVLNSAFTSAAHGVESGNCARRPISPSSTTRRARPTCCSISSTR